jgi:hypothetical protein
MGRPVGGTLLTPVAALASIQAYSAASGSMIRPGAPDGAGKGPQPADAVAQRSTTGWGLWSQPDKQKLRSSIACAGFVCS